MVRELDVTNPWEAHAFFMLSFHCDDCRVWLEIDSAHPVPSNEWYIELAEFAFNNGWYIPHASREAIDEVHCWCPSCGQKRHLTQPPYKSVDDPTI